jgi:hypothetical protein
MHLLHMYSTAAASLNVYTLYTYSADASTTHVHCTALLLHHTICTHVHILLVMHLYVYRTAAASHHIMDAPHAHTVHIYFRCIYACTAITTVHVYTLMIWHVYSCVCTYVLYSVHCTHFCGCICTCIAVSEQMYCTCKVYTVHNSADAFSRVQLCLHLCTVNVQCTLYTFLRMHLHVQKVSNQVIAMTQQFLNQLLSFLDRQFFSVARPNKIKFTKF